MRSRLAGWVGPLLFALCFGVLIGLGKTGNRLGFVVLLAVILVGVGLWEWRERRD